jgi:AcrR family transcriptional regulator
MTIRKPPKSAGRAPKRSNGIKRRETILHAATEIISESGLAGLTLNATARRAKSSIGSMYHFFSDKEQLLDALRERHREAMADIMGNVAAIDMAEWNDMSTAEVIDTLFGKPLNYYSKHPFALELHQLREGREVDSFMTILQSVMNSRLGDEHGTRVANMLYAISTGTLSFLLDSRDSRQRALVAEIPTALTTYLVEHESAFDRGGKKAHR